MNKRLSALVVCAVTTLPVIICIRIAAPQSAASLLLPAGVDPIRSSSCISHIMSTTPHSALSITQPPVPVFTPNPACLRTTNIWRISERCSSPVEDCSWLYLGEPHDVQNNALPSECFPDSVRHPATRCPESYSSVKVGEAIHDGTTYRSLHCCPT